MKKIILMVIAITSLFCTTFAQDGSPLVWKMKAGFLFAPQGVFTTEKPRGVVILPLMVGISFTDTKNTVNVLYNITITAVQAVYAHQFNNFGMYILANKSIVDRNAGYGCFAFTKGVADGRAVAFAEFGTTTQRWDPSFHLGVIIPLMWQIKKK